MDPLNSVCAERRALFEAVEQLAVIEERARFFSAAGRVIQSLGDGYPDEIRLFGEKLLALLSEIAESSQSLFGPDRLIEIAKRRTELSSVFDGVEIEFALWVNMVSARSVSLSELRAELSRETDLHGLICVAGVWIRAIETKDADALYPWLIAERLFLQRGPGGLWAVMDRGQAQPALNYLSSHAEVSGGVEQSAHQFFFEAAQKLSGAIELEEVLEQGLYVEIQGFLRALGGALFHPSVLYAALSLNAALRNRIASLGADLNEDQLEARISKCESRLAASFEHLEPYQAPPPSLERRNLEPAKRAPKPKSNKGGKSGKAAKAAKTGKTGKTGKAERTGTGKMVRRLGLVSALAGVAFVVVGSSRWALEAQARPAKLQLSSISSVLANGHLTETSPRVFLGQVKAEAWRGMNKHERARIAEFIRMRLKSEGVEQAWIKDGERVVIRIDASGVLWVI